MNPPFATLRARTCRIEGTDVHRVIGCDVLVEGEPVAQLLVAGVDWKLRYDARSVLVIEVLQGHVDCSIESAPERAA